MQMMPFLLKCAMLILILFFGVLLGMEHANNGLLQMRGYDDNSFASIFQIKQSEAGELEATVFGNDITKKDIKERQQQLEQMQAYNFFSDLGSKLADMLAACMQALLQAIVNGIHKILASFASSS